jgi:Family of unknown function (DUF6188)
MYGLPSDFDPSGFVGKALEQISFSANTIHLAFEDGFSITLESSFAHKKGDELLEEGVVPLSESRLMQLVAKIVVRGEVLDRGTLVLHFEEGRSLFCYDDSTTYESYRITRKGMDDLIV